MGKKVTTKPKNKSLAQKILTIIGAVAFALLAIPHLLFTQGAASIGVWVQAVPALLATFTFVLSAYRVVKGLPVTKIIFFGTLPLWLVHIPITILIENESPIFIIATSIAPAIAGIVLVVKNRKAAYTR